MTDLGPFEWLRHLMSDDDADEVYADLSSGGSEQGRVVAGIVSYLAREYCPEFFSIANRPALAACAQLFDEHPWLTPTLAVRSIEILRGRAAISPQDIIDAAQLLDDGP